MRQFLFAALLISAMAASAGDSNKVTVNGERVNIRSRSSLSGELMGQVMRGDELILAGQTNDGFIAIHAPEWVESWVSAEFLNEGVVLPPKLNVRAGPNMNYGVVAVVSRGDKLDVLQEINGWIKIKAPTNAIAWISEEFIGPAKPPEPKMEITIINEPKPKVEDKKDSDKDDMESAYKKMVAEDSKKAEKKSVEPKLGPLVPVIFEADSERDQGKYYNVAGILQPSRSIKLYRIVGIDGRTKCFISGNAEQMRRLVGKPMRLEGKAFYYKRLELPVVKPTSIKWTKE